MLDHDYFRTTEQMVWADLGCGSGTFTLALASLLSPGSFVYAIDRNAAALQQIPSGHNRVSIKKYQSDFISDRLPLEKVDGILMANALHYIQHKDVFIKKTASALKDAGRFLIVEYNTDLPVPVWVPFPISFVSLQSLFRGAGFNDVRLLNERPSAYGHAPLYSAVITK